MVTDTLADRSVIVAHGQLRVFPITQSHPHSNPVFFEASPELSTMLAMLQVCAQTALEDIIDETTYAPLCLIPVFPMRDWGQASRVLFWQKLKLGIRIDGRGDCSWYFLPSVVYTSMEALLRGVAKVFGAGVMDRIKMAHMTTYDTYVGTSVGVLTAPIKDMMTRAAWQANIAALIQHTELTDTLQDLYRTRAQERRVSAEVVEKEVMNAAIAFTDLVRAHLIEYTEDMKSNTYERMSLQDHCGLPCHEWRRIRAELRDISVESYPEDVKAVINMPECEEMQPESVVGRLCRLQADGTYMPSFLMLLRAHGLLRLDRSK
ncbi:unnamed protein product [Vitrella brassicaformis CCMP3155]|uniref:Uncharacterized protein n=1 Tax=Vitrella brassicaformis (strain CCMP3155) TaxID=1169540 RepID=A0A0G4FK19_VITBC|nr:unnamed protein product [Vitrella brassicaformis CCMP3155]|mmetsp:Transcript_290/g.923  ORF Transcript_290/g.923 Transcript_290/m.923 type:complete len:319 (-) Transcript_290:533-1489(-)|eukprot:CEM13899.1 unnamed protein product [Vitrella brassicaformis CCMP3155]